MVQQLINHTKNYDYSSRLYEFIQRNRQNSDFMNFSIVYAINALHLQISENIKQIFFDHASTNIQMFENFIEKKLLIDCICDTQKRIDHFFKISVENYCFELVDLLLSKHSSHNFDYESISFNKDRVDDNAKLLRIFAKHQPHMFPKIVSPSAINKTNYFSSNVNKDRVDDNAQLLRTFAKHQPHIFPKIVSPGAVNKTNYFSSNDNKVCRSINSANHSITFGALCTSIIQMLVAKSISFDTTVSQAMNKINENERAAFLDILEAKYVNISHTVSSFVMSNFDKNNYNALTFEEKESLIRIYLLNLNSMNWPNIYAKCEVFQLENSSVFSEFVCAVVDKIIRAYSYTFTHNTSIPINFFNDVVLNILGKKLDDNISTTDLKTMTALTLYFIVATNKVSDVAVEYVKLLLKKLVDSNLHIHFQIICCVLTTKLCCYDKIFDAFLSEMTVDTQIKLSKNLLNVDVLDFRFVLDKCAHLFNTSFTEIDWLNNGTDNYFNKIIKRIHPHSSNYDIWRTEYDPELLLGYKDDIRPPNVTKQTKPTYNTVQVSYYDDSAVPKHVYFVQCDQYTRFKDIAVHVCLKENIPEEDFQFCVIKTRNYVVLNPNEYVVKNSANRFDCVYSC